MENVDKVFHSNIMRGEKQLKNNLYDLLHIVPAIPLELKDIINGNTCNFNPKIDKVYIPKRRPKVKVKTVRYIRESFESDTYVYLTKDLETQQNYLLKQIRSGSSKSDKTVKVAKSIFKCDLPKSKSIWQMLTNINPENHRYNQQFVLWNRKYIQVNGSGGGRNKLICNYDLADTKFSSKIIKRINNNKVNKKKGLLRNSLAIKFKPGPLGKKKFLDDSHQKCNGNIELVDLPKIGLDIEPRYGTAMEPIIMSCLNDLRQDDGIISRKWAELAVSVLGNIENGLAKLLSRDCVTFGLKYKCDQNRILMRKDLDSTCTTKREHTSTMNKTSHDDKFTILPEIKCMMNKILDAVEISINQDKMFTTDEDLCDNISNDSLTKLDVASNLKEKTKKRYCELGRLDVTVITLPNSNKKKSSEDCRNLHCNLGCVCDSLTSTYTFREHCGREECIFDCKCDFSKYNSINSLGLDSSGWIPAIIGIEDDINMRLAKEEQKFHQTVIVTGENNILFKSEKRNWKCSKKYDNFYKNMCLKSVNQRKLVLSVNLLKINFDNIEPWCMVHNLYKCFCKGKFTDTNSSIPIVNHCDEPLSKDTITNIDVSSEITTVPVKRCLRPRGGSEVVSDVKIVQVNSITDKPLTYANTLKSDITKKKTPISPSKESSAVSILDKNLNKNKLGLIDLYDTYCSNYSGTCSRVIAYEGRKYSDGHYKNTNYKIKEMEENDKSLQQKMKSILKTNSDTNDSDKVNKSRETSKENVMTNDIEETPMKDSKALQAECTKGPNFIEFFYDIDGLRSSDCGRSNRKLLPSENRLVTWLESNYKLYKQRGDTGLVKTSLEAPKAGKVALYSWDFILSRYRERKNLFLISKQKPYRIFMGVNANIPIFQVCININEIKLADLHKYPQTIKNLLTNATDLKDNFCILRGFTHCWELVGSVTKLDENDDNTPGNENDLIDISEETSDLEVNLQYNRSEECNDLSLRDDSSENQEMLTDSLTDPEDLLECSEEVDSSKWFVMMVENDFHEIRFYKKGFFVKHESILKAIDVARLSGKSVRLSSQKCVDLNSIPQFGVYAIPNTTQYCVFIGPYEMRDSLGIETVKTMLDIRKTQRTRGFWITTSKIDNLRVIDNPMSFISLTNLESKEAVVLENNSYGDSPIIKLPELSNPGCDKTLSQPLSLLKAKNKTIKKVKPIKIRKPKEIFNWTSNVSLKGVGNLFTYMPFGSQNQNLPTHSDVILNSSQESVLPDNDAFDFHHITPASSDDPFRVADEPQIKITAVYSQKDESNFKLENKSDKGMFILKPEEINRKLLQGELKAGMTPAEDVIDELSNTEFGDIVLQTSNGLATCVIDNDICVISDDES